MSTPQSLLNAVLFYNGNSFALRAVKEQVDLRSAYEESRQIHLLRTWGEEPFRGVADKGYGKIVMLSTLPRRCAPIVSLARPSLAGR
jgi:hypothetical protein